jgi:hypothetical protein
VGKPDVSAYHTTPKDLFAGRRHFGNTNLTKEARLYHAGASTQATFSLESGGKTQLTVNQDAIFCA